MSEKKVRTRFAPSPTGYLHVGGVRTALFNYLFAKQKTGKFILRLEDTDRERFVAEGIEQIVESLMWLSLKPDEGFWISEGKHQNIEYIQSERQKTGLYKKYTEQLVEEGLAYSSYVTLEKIEMQKRNLLNKPFIYKRTMEDSWHDGQTQAPPGQKQPIRLDTKAIKQKLGKTEITWSDKVRGDFSSDLSLMEDFILIKSDGYPTYNFANVIDDHEMGISHVIRGDEFIASTAKHAVLYELFGWRQPAFVHLPVINGLDGKKLSKRTGDTNVLDYRDKGYLPEALLNFLALLGWNDGTEQEIFSREELVKKFSQERLNTSPAIFDRRRLDWMNGHYIRELSIDELNEKAEAFWPKEAKDATEPYKKAVLGLVQERLKYLAELPELVRYFFTEPNISDVSKLYREPVDEQLQKNPPNFKKFLEAVIEELPSSDFSTQDIQTRLNKLLKSLVTKPAILFPIIRIAITGSSVSPEIFGTLHVLGKEKSLQRLKNALKSLE